MHFPVETVNSTAISGDFVRSLREQLLFGRCIKVLKRGGYWADVLWEPQPSLWYPLYCYPFYFSRLFHIFMLILRV